MAKRKFKMPTKSDLNGRSSTISNAFAISVTPYIYPNEEEINQFHSLLEIEEGQCAYCLGIGNGRDHLRPLVENGMPTGYITEIKNLVPCCQECNSSKGGKAFREWYKSDKNLKRLKKRMKLDEINHRFDIICAYEERIGEPLNYENLVGKEIWNEYRERKDNMIKMLKDNQEFCDKVSAMIKEKIK